MRRVLVFTFVVMASAGVGARQSQPTFRATTQLVVQTVTVKDKNGRPVEDLTVKDFIVTEDGRPQELAFAEYQRIDDGPATSVTVTTAPNPVTQTGVAPVTQGLMAGTIGSGTRFAAGVWLSFTSISIAWGSSSRCARSRVRIGSVSTRMTTADLVALMVFDGRGVRFKQDFTDDRGALREALDSLVNATDERNRTGIDFDTGGAFGENDDTFSLFATDRQLAALQGAVTDLRPLPELKTLVYFGSGLRLSGTDNVAQLRATINAAVRANVTLNPIDARGLMASAPLGDATRPSLGGIGMFNGSVAQASIGRGLASQDMLYALAKDTGGRAMFDNNDLALGIAEAARAVTGYYILGYYSQNVAKDGRYRRVTVRLAPGRTGELAYRSGYYGDKDFTKFNRAEKEQQLAEALKLGDPITDIPMAATVNYFQLNGAEYFVAVSVRMPSADLARAASSGASHVEIDMIGEVKDAHAVTNRNVRDVIRIPAGTASEEAGRLIQYETGFTMLPGSYVIKLLARNGSTGRIGTFESSFTIPNLERETTEVRLSSVVMSQQRVAAAEAIFTVKQKVAAEVANPLVESEQKLVPAVGHTFSAARPLYLLMEAYQRDTTVVRPLVAYVTFYRDGARVFETPPLGLERWNAKTKALPIRFTIAPGAIAASSYTCQVTVLDPTGVRVTFRRYDVTIR